MDNNKILNVKNLSVEYKMRGKFFGRSEGASLKAVNGISFSVKHGETLGIVGESGCGKTTTGLAVLRMLDIATGSIEFDGEDIANLSRKRLRPLRQKMQMVYQDPFGALNPRMRVRDIIGEPLKAHNVVSDSIEYKEKIYEILDIVGLSKQMGERYPHEFSGGQRQRIGIARALILNPKLVVCDEPVSALDVSIQAQIINLLDELQERLGVTYLFIAHDLAIVQHISHRVMVMYLGNIVEIAERSQLYNNPKHPYTKALLSAIPVPSPDIEANREFVMLEGEVPSPLDPPKGCPFHPRCSEARVECREKKPVLKNSEGSHEVACHLY